MSSGEGSGVLTLLQPDLLTVEELISKIQSIEEPPTQGLTSSNRLKPPPTTYPPSRKIRLNSNKKIEKRRSMESSLSCIIIKDRRKLREVEKRKNEEENDLGIVRCESSAERKITLKRAPVEEKHSSESEPSTKSKRQRNTINWP